MTKKEQRDAPPAIRKSRFEVLSPHSDEVAEFITSRFGAVRIDAHQIGQPVGLAIQFGAMPGLVFDQTTFTGGYDLVPQALINGVFFKFPLSGGIAIRSGRSDVEASEKYATCDVSQQLDRLRFFNGRKHSQLGVLQSMCEERLEVLFDRSVPTPVTFEPKVELAAGPIRQLASLVHFLAETDFGDIHPLLPFNATYMPHIIVDSILTCWPHNYSHLFHVPVAAARRRDVKRALDYLEVHLLDMESLDELAFASGVSLRSLQYAFMAELGMGIVEYQHRLRLNRARDDVVHHADQRIAAIATRWGFANIGRFSREFRRTFGVSPSQLRKRDPRSPS